MKTFLYSKKEIKEWEKLAGRKLDKDRRTGRTTAIAFFTIGKALKNPYKWLQIKDHHNSFASNKYLTSKIQDIISSLHLEGFEISILHSKIRFNLVEQ